VLYDLGRVSLPKEVLAPIIEEIKDAFKEYNRSISGSGYYLKPIHYASKSIEGKKRKYIYLGRYWWKVLYLGRDERGKAKIRWVYLGKNRPSNLPEPPTNPLEGVVFYSIEGDSENYYIEEKVSSETLKKIADILSDSRGNEYYAIKAKRSHDAK